MMTFNRKDTAVGGIFIAIGLFLGSVAYLKLPIGVAFRMGPGFFPVTLAAILVVIGVIVILSSLGSQSTPFGVVPWRGALLVLLMPIAFGLTVQGLGLVGALLVSVLIAARADRTRRFGESVVIAIGLTVFCVAVFHYGLGLPIRLFGPWLKWWG